MVLKKLDELVEIAKNKKTVKIAVAAAEDEHVLEAIKDAYTSKLIEPILIGNKEKILKISQNINFNIKDNWIINENNPVLSSQKAVELVKNQKADILMKGLVQTADFLRAVLHNENGIRKNGVLSHIGIFETPFYHKLIGVTDAALNIAPTLKEKAEIIKNGVELFNKLNYNLPKVAVIGAVEVVNPKMQPTIDAAALTVMNKRNQITKCIIDGPLALDNAVSKEAAAHKNITSEVAGDADLIMTPYIEVGNALYKSMNFIGGAKVSAVLMGAKVPIVLTSRADSKESKFYSIALASAMA